MSRIDVAFRLIATNKDKWELFVVPLAVALLTLAMVVPAAASEARGGVLRPVVEERPAAQAKKDAAGEKNWVIVKATAEWCGPCKQMEKTTWSEAKILAWLKVNAMVVEVDVDKEPKVASQLGIKAMPTVIAFKDGVKEFDRVVGYKGPADFLAWLEGMTRGETSLDAIRRRAGDRDGGQGKVNIRARWDLARSLQSKGKFDEAADEYVWLWRHMLEYEPAMSAVRNSFMAADMQELASRRDGAKRKFTELRDEAEKAFRGEKVELVVDWVDLNRIVGDGKRTLTWFDRVKEEARWKPVLQRLSFLFEELLIQDKRWADLGKLYSDPMTSLEQSHESLVRLNSRASPNTTSERNRVIFENSSSRLFRRKAGRLYAALLAAAREEEAQKLSARAQALDNAPGMVETLVSTALNAGQVRKQHVAWLEKAVKTDASLESLLKQVQTVLERQEKK